MHLEIADATQKLYVCPGESIPISYSVHLGRLAQCYPACEACPLNCETGATPMPATERLRKKHERQLSEVEISFGRIRGVYLNRIDRRVTSDIVGQFASELWNNVQRAVQTHRRERIVDWEPPRVVIGYDQRSSSPDIMTGLQDRLRLMGCDVVDLGLTIGPALQFAIRLHKANAGVFVTGAGHSPSWTGLDFFDHTGMPRDVSGWNIPTIGVPPLKHARPIRSSGQHAFKPVSKEYSRRLSRFVRPRREMTICVGVEDRVSEDHIRNVFHSFGERLRIVNLPKRPRDLSNVNDADALLVGEAVIASQADMGFVVDEDVRNCLVTDELGEPASPDEIAFALDDSPTFATVKTPWHELASTHPTADVVCGETIYAFPNKAVQCDAGLTLASIVTAFSEMNVAVSDFVDARRNLKVSQLRQLRENTLPLAGGSELRSGEGTVHRTGRLSSR